MEQVITTGIPIRAKETPLVMDASKRTFSSFVLYATAFVLGLVAS